jgi:hypothetical protein
MGLHHSVYRAYRISDLPSEFVVARKPLSVKRGAA